MTTFAYSQFLDLTNEVLEELNEVPLTSGNFASAIGFQLVAKNAVNKAIRDIQNQQWEWPWNHVQTTQVLTPGVPIYALPNNCRSVDWDTFFIARDDNLTSPQTATWVPQVSWDDYVQKLKPLAEQQDSSQWAPPKAIYRTQNTEFGVYPFPDQAYTIEYEYWKTYSGLVNYNDPSSVPNLFDYVVFNGAMYYCYRFRENAMAAADAKSAFEQGIENMRNIYIIDYLKLTDMRAGPQFNQVFF